MPTPVYVEDVLTYRFQHITSYSQDVSSFLRSSISIPGAKTIKKNINSTQNKSQTHRAKQYEVTSFLSTYCELSTETCSKNVYSIGPRSSSSVFTRWSCYCQFFRRPYIYRIFGNLLLFTDAFG